MNNEEKENWEREIEIRHKARMEFAKRERELKTGYLILIDSRIAYYPTKKDWERDKGTEQYKQKYLQGEIWAATSLNLWHEWLREREKYN